MEVHFKYCGKYQQEGGILEIEYLWKCNSNIVGNISKEGGILEIEYLWKCILNIVGNVGKRGKCWKSKKEGESENQKLGKN